MNYLIFIAVGILSVAAVFIFCSRKGVADIGKPYKPYDDIAPYKGATLILMIIVCFAMALAIQISLYKNTSIINFVKLYGLFLIVLCAGIVDSKCRIIPNVLIIAGLFFRAGIYIYEVITVEEIKNIIINDLIGFAIGFVFLGIVSFISKGALGFGDVKLFGVIGIISGSFCTYSTLLVSLVISLIVSVFNIARKKMGKKDSFPFGPCISIGYIIAILLTSY